MSMDELRQQVGRMAVDRIRRVKQLLEAFEAGDMPASRRSAGSRKWPAAMTIGSCESEINTPRRFRHEVR